jgi:carboxypeptidase C (cathepsin A)
MRSLPAALVALVLAACSGGGGDSSGSGSGPPPPPPGSGYTDPTFYSSAAGASLSDPQEISAVTRHQLMVGGTTLDYTATAGHLTALALEDGSPRASFFYVAYTQDGADPATRPLTFFYNGGPGSASVWLHLGSFGPKRLVTHAPSTDLPTPLELGDNAESLLDVSDLVFVDAVGTGFSEAVAPSVNRTFYGVVAVAAVFRVFVRRYVDVNQRDASPKFLFGESYGTTRSAGLVNKLQSQGMAFNGVVLLSSILNYASNSPGLDQNYIGSLPTFAAIAWYHDKVPNKPASMEAFVNEARAFATGEYASALARGQSLTQAEEDALATKLSRFTGLSPQYLKEANFRVSQGRFRKELLRDERRTVGRYDARYEGIDLDAAGENPEYDASDTAIAGAFVAAFNNYVEGTLKWQSDVPYKPTSFDIIREWDWKHEQPGSRFPQRQPYVAGDLARAMRENPHLHVMSANGYFDLATPFFATEFDLGHMQLDPLLRKNLEFTYYPSGHMVYLNVDALAKFKADLSAFYDQAKSG